jgi:hypothetical protein
VTGALHLVPLKVTAWPRSSTAAQNFFDGQDTELKSAGQVMPVGSGWLQVSTEAVSGAVARALAGGGGPAADAGLDGAVSELAEDRVGLAGQGGHLGRCGVAAGGLVRAGCEPVDLAGQRGEGLACGEQMGADAVPLWSVSDAADEGVSSRGGRVLLSGVRGVAHVAHALPWPAAILFSLPLLVLASAPITSRQRHVFHAETARDQVFLQMDLR